MGRGLGRSATLTSHAERELVEYLSRYPLEHPGIGYRYLGNAEVASRRLESDRLILVKALLIVPPKGMTDNDASLSISAKDGKQSTFDTLGPQVDRARVGSHERSCKELVAVKPATSVKRRPAREF